MRTDAINWFASSELCRSLQDGGKTALTLECGEASVLAGKNWFGYAQLGPEHGWRSICAVYGGSAAELVLLNSYDPEGGKNDWEYVRDALSEHGYTDGGQALWTHTVNLVCGHVAAITFLATYLAHHRLMDGASIDDLLRPWCPRWPR